LIKINDFIIHRFTIYKSRRNNQGELTMITVREMMSSDLITLSRFNSLSDARNLMDAKQVRHILIVDDEGQLLGLVSHRDILARGISSQKYAEKEELDKIESGILLSDIMTTKLISVTANLPIANAAKLIFTKKIGCLPVTDYKNKLVGIITDHDFVAITIQLLDIMAQEEPLDEGFN